MSSSRDRWLELQEWTRKKVRSSNAEMIPVEEREIFSRQEPELDYQYFLENASRTMIRFKKPERLIRMIVTMIDEHVKTTHTAMLLRKERSEHFNLIDSKGSEGVKLPVGFIKMTLDNPLIRLFHEHHNFKISENGAVSYRNMLGFLSREDLFRDSPELSELIELAIKQMELLKAAICIPIYYKSGLRGLFILGKKQKRSGFSRQEVSFFTTLANDVAMALSNAQLIQDLQEKIFEIHQLYEREHSIFINTSISLAAAIDARDPYTHGHTERVTRYALAVAQELSDIPEAKMYRNFRETLHIAGLLHDVGKIGVPDSILNKKGGLTKQEYEKVKEHSVTGAAILYPIRELGDIAREVRSHHERYDGRGYPDGLKGDEIPFIARIISVSDTFDAITSDRPYRQKKMAEIAVQIIKDNSGTQFDPIVVSAFLLAYKKGNLKNVI